MKYKFSKRKYNISQAYSSESIRLESRNIVSSAHNLSSRVLDYSNTVNANGWSIFREYIGQVAFDKYLKIVVTDSKSFLSSIS